jgi:hypothetical protein
MRKTAGGLGLAAVIALVVALAAIPAAAGVNRKLVEGTVYDTTACSAECPPCPPPPHCGPITQKEQTGVICARRATDLIACPLYKRIVVCVQAPCPGTISPIYSGEGAIVKVRRRGSATVLATLPVVEGHFKIRLGAGEYVFHPYLGEEPCWSGAAVMQRVTPRLQSPVPVAVDVSNSCVAHPDGR